MPDTGDRVVENAFFHIRVSFPITGYTDTDSEYSRFLHEASKTMLTMSLEASESHVHMGGSCEVAMLKH